MTDSKRNTNYNDLEAIKRLDSIIINFTDQWARNLLWECNWIFLAKLDVYVNNNPKLFSIKNSIGWGVQMPSLTPYGYTIGKIYVGEFENPFHYYSIHSRLKTIEGSRQILVY